MKALVPLFITLQTFVADRVERLQADKDKGAGVVEYAALLFLVGTLVAALYASGLATKFDNAVKQAVEHLFNNKVA